MPSASSPWRKGGSSNHNGTHASSNSAGIHSEPESASDSILDGSEGEAEEEEGESSEEVSSEEEEGKQLYKADITPHHRAEKRPQRRSAVKASDAWSQLKIGSTSSRKNNTIVEVVIETPIRSSGRTRKRTSVWSPDADIVASTPTKKVAEEKRPAITPKGKEKEKVIDLRVEEAAIQTPSKKQKVVTPSKKSIPVTPTRAIKKVKTFVEAERLNERFFIQPTSSDAYFANHAPRSKQRSSKHQTSDNVISGTIPPISSKMVAKLSADISSQLEGKGPAFTLLKADYFQHYYDYWWSLLEYTNRPLLFYGVGSKRAQLQHFARYQAKQGQCACIVVRGESGGRIDDVIKALERSINYIGTSTEQRRLYSTPLEARAHGIVQSLDDNRNVDIPPSILILIHNFDTPLLLQERSLHTLGILSASDRIHICVDTCHVNSGLLAHLHSDTEQGFLQWLWINMNTYVPMLEEIINERGTGISRTIGLPRVLDIRAAGGGGIGGHDDDDDMLIDDSIQDRDTSAGLLSERAAIQILKSVTIRARKLFFLLAEDLLKKMEDPSTIRPSVKYSSFLILAERIFQGPENVRSVLMEFTSHSLILIEGQQQQNDTSLENGVENQGLQQTHSGASVSIALSKTVLNRVYHHPEFKAP